MTYLAVAVISFIIGVTFAPLLVAFLSVRRDEKRERWAFDKEQRK